MKLKPAKRKKHCRLNRSSPFPIKKDETIIYKGRFNGFSVIIDDPKDMNSINSMGYFGKGNLSKSYPNYNTQTQPIIIRKRQYKSRQNLIKKYNSDNSNSLQPMIVVNDSDIEENTFDKLNSELKYTLNLKESLYLTLEEAFFLLNELKCLKIKNFDNKYLDTSSAWKLFADSQHNFIQNYAVYIYFRARNWVVKSGLKFGSDFLLYKEGPPFFHASYIVNIHVLFKDTLDKNIDLSSKSTDWTSLIGLNRLTETAAKEVIICQVIWPPHISLCNAKESKEIIKQLSINTILMRRWIAKQERK